jgi:sister-chromatid-cohesion protein PDS5
MEAKLNLDIGQFPDPVKAEADLHKFAKLNDHRAVKLLRTLMDPDSDSRTISKNLEEVLKRVEKASSSILDTIAILIRRSGFLLINRSTIPHLFERISRASEASQAVLELDEEEDADAQVQSFGRIAKSIVETIIKNCPSLLKLYLPQLCQMVQEEKQKSTLELALYGIGAVVAAHPDAFQRDS